MGYSPRGHRKLDTAQVTYNGCGVGGNKRQMKPPDNDSIREGINLTRSMQEVEGPGLREGPSPCQPL